MNGALLLIILSIRPVFLSKEISYPEPVKEEQFRTFNGFSSFSADILAETLIAMKNKLSKYGIEYNLLKMNYKIMIKKLWLKK